MAPCVSASPVGLVVVHGIGNQCLGKLADRVAVALADEGSLTVQSGDPTERVCTRSITAQGRTVLVREANWAAESHPDNPPRVRLATYLFRDFFETVSCAWSQSLLSRYAPGASPQKALMVSGALGLLLALSWIPFFAGLIGIEAVPGAWWLVLGGFGPILLILFAAFNLFSARSLRSQHLPKPRRLSLSACWLPMVTLAGATHVLMILASSLLLLFSLALIVPAIGIDYLAFILVTTIAALGSRVGHLGLVPIARWIYRLTWTMVVLPVHTLLQVVRTFGNLVSVALLESKLVVRLASIPWAIATLFFFMVLSLLCEILILFPLVIWLPDQEAAADAPAVSVSLALIWTAGYLASLKLVLPAIDLLLDIGNYHLASDADRRAYFVPIEDAVVALQSAGCTQIHILAHSLGTVITYDWLRGKPEGHSIAVLHTIGSPLNKFWYIDRRRLSRQEDASGIPGLRWHNYWAVTDAVSGRVSRYGATPSSDTRVRRLGWPLVSHVNYWGRREVLDAVRRELAGAPCS